MYGRPSEIQSPLGGEQSANSIWDETAEAEADQPPLSAAIVKRRHTSVKRTLLTRIKRHLRRLLQ